MQITSYLSFNGECDEAFKFYEKCFGGKIIMKVTLGETPMAKDLPVEFHQRIAHVRLIVGDAILMGADACQNYTKPQGFFINLGIAQPEEAERLFQALSDQGTIQMPLEENFWAHRFGMVVDQFGTPWMVNCEKTN